MPWATVAQLILQIGLPAVQYIIQQIEGGTNATSTTLAQVIAMANKKAVDEMTAVLTAQGIDPASDKGKAFLALVQ